MRTRPPTTTTMGTHDGSPSGLSSRPTTKSELEAEEEAQRHQHPEEDRLLSLQPTQVVHSVSSVVSVGADRRRSLSVDGRLELPGNIANGASGPKFTVHRGTSLG